VSIKNDGHYFCRAGGNRPDGLNEPVTFTGQVLHLLSGEMEVKRAPFWQWLKKSVACDSKS
ncbi:hypothetical protein, partial [Escherichia coli]|uniref:hypothetical protein n=1 Tax=Escherichia coli TaxID=562 RepID=UPI001BEBAFDD